MHQKRLARNNILKGMLLKIKTRRDIDASSFVSEELVIYTINEKKQYYLQKNPKNIRQCFIRIYIFCYVWSFGGGLKVRFNGFCFYFKDFLLFSEKIISKMII